RATRCAWCPRLALKDVASRDLRGGFVSPFLVHSRRCESNPRRRDPVEKVSISVAALSEKKKTSLLLSTDIVERITAHGPQYVPARCVEVADAIAARMEKKKKSENAVYLCLHLADFCLKNGA